MDKKIVWGGVGIIIVIVIGILVLYEPRNTLAPGNPVLEEGGVEIVFRYGVGAINELNTIEGTFTRDMVVDPPITIPLNISENVKSDIYQKALDLDVFNISTEPLDENVYVTPCSSYYIRINTPSEENEAVWDSCRGDVAEPLINFSNYLIQTIQSQEEYKALPTPNGGYM